MKTERECVEAAQAAFAAMKSAVEDLREAVLGIAAHNPGEDRFLHRNAAYISLGEVESLGGDVKQLHGKQTARLAEFFPEFLKVVATGGGGR